MSIMLFIVFVLKCYSEEGDIHLDTSEVIWTNEPF